jgi:hypothetical protein
MNDRHQGPPLHDVVAAVNLADSVEAGRLHLDIVRDLKRVNSHLAAAPYPILEGEDELLPSRLKHGENTGINDPTAATIVCYVQRHAFITSV